MTTLQKMLLSESEEKIRSKAVEMFSEKSFLQRFKSLSVISNISKYVLPIFSISTGIFFLSSLLKPITNNTFISIFISIVLLVLYELAKLSIISNAVKSFYSQFKIGFAALIITGITLSVGSAFMSISGAAEIYKLSDSSIQQINSQHIAVSDSVNRKIVALEILKPKRWGGLLSASENQMILNYQSELQRLNKEKAISTTLALNNTQYNQYVIGGIVAIIELLIILSSWFYIFYYFICYKEENSEYHFNPTDNTLNHQLQPLQKTSSKQRIIGFNPTGQQPRAKNIKDAIESGLKDYRTLMKTFGLNVNQTKKYLQQYG